MVAPCSKHNNCKLGENISFYCAWRLFAVAVVICPVSFVVSGVARRSGRIAHLSERRRKEIFRMPYEIVLAAGAVHLSRREICGVKRNAWITLSRVLRSLLYYAIIDIINHLENVKIKLIFRLF